MKTGFTAGDRGPLNIRLVLRFRPAWVELPSVAQQVDPYPARPKSVAHRPSAGHPGRTWRSQVIRDESGYLRAWARSRRTTTRWTRRRATRRSIGIAGSRRVPRGAPDREENLVCVAILTVATGAAVDFFIVDAAATETVADEVIDETTITIHGAASGAITDGGGQVVSP